VPSAWIDDQWAAERLRNAYAIWLRERRVALPQIIEEADRVRPTSL